MTNINLIPNGPIASSSSDLKVPTVRRPWTEQEDSALIASVKQYGSSRGPGSAWGKISKAVGGNRTNKDCRKRWFHSLDPNLRKGKWTTEEDEKLKNLYDELGPQWKDIALRIPGRKDDQVSKRWRDVLDPKLTPKKPWASLEDALLLQLFEEHGPKWTTIADHLPGRSPLACRNRSRKYLKTTIDQRDPNAGGNEVTNDDQLNNSPFGETSAESESTDVLLNWAFPDIANDPQINSVNPLEPLHFDYSMGQPAGSSLSNIIPVTSNTNGPTQTSQGLQDLFEGANINHPNTVPDPDNDPISQWIASLSSELSPIGQMRDLDSGQTHTGMSWYSH
ncbi:uncharacterized protein I303_106370 [Kwoniella dejecticola CBS 10117]|uniref:Uncharacterized protein n=1 Tax=Kwoniella dejecticola CBS 10117 TaxID=1296121 RepID=A0A1A5ZUW7_9TREE|nr:uncharacterized protein I303_08373 [Kwoniella dejecticola CBS 10117]OBR81602.1 hypothetical protein I303_08373 [Kwoniella dejecticola CBS 10117]